MFIIVEKGIGQRINSDYLFDYLEVWSLSPPKPLLWHLSRVPAYFRFWDENSAPD
jgi:hypothetical protein